MTIIVEDNTGKLEANSYVSVDEVEKYLSLRGVEYDSEKLQSLMILACDFIRGYSQRFYGKKLNENQGLDFPRVLGTKQIDVPSDIKLAQIQLVKLQVELPEVFAAKTKDDFVIREKIDVLDLTYSESAFSASNSANLRPIIDLIMQFGSNGYAGQFKAVRG